MSSFSSRFTELDICPSEFMFREAAFSSSSLSFYHHSYFSNSDPVFQSKSSFNTIPRQRSMTTEDTPIIDCSMAGSRNELTPKSQLNLAEKHISIITKKLKRFFKTDTQN